MELKPHYWPFDLDQSRLCYPQLKKYFELASQLGIKIYAERKSIGRWFAIEYKNHCITAHFRGIDHRGTKSWRREIDEYIVHYMEGERESNRLESKINKYNNSVGIGVVYGDDFALQYMLCLLFNAPINELMSCFRHTVSGRMTHLTTNDECKDKLERLVQEGVERFKKENGLTSIEA